MQNTSGLILYFLFVLVLVAAYLGIRRQWAPPAAIAAVCVVASFILMMLISLAQGNSIYQAIFVGLLVGGLFSSGILGMAWYFHRNELRKTEISAESDDAQSDTTEG
jgi:Na+/H+-translocating membrane pyrophosphatase